jgi:hypothetical protein
MNKQDKIEELLDYGFSVEEAAEQLFVSEEFVNLASTGNPTHMDTTGRDFRNTGRVRSMSDVTMDAYELLHKYDYKKINSVLKIDGLRGAARYFDVDVGALFTLKVHFGYHKQIPMNALKHIVYFSDEMRKAIKRRDNEACVRCNHEATMFFKIDIGGYVEIDNCAMLCEHCRSKRMSKHIKNNKNVFKDMRHTEFITWIKENDPYKPISRKSSNG